MINDNLNALYIHQVPEQSFQAQIHSCLSHLFSPSKAGIHCLKNYLKQWVGDWY